MHRFKVSYTTKKNQTPLEKPPTSSFQGARVEAMQLASWANVRSVVILRDSGGSSNAANAGKFYLYQIVK